MKVEIETLRAALDRILGHVEEMRGDSVEVSDDLYWFVQKDELHNPANTPRGLTLGSLVDDWAEVSAVGRDEKEPIGYDLVWAASVLRALGDRTP